MTYSSHSNKRDLRVNGKSMSREANLKQIHAIGLLMIVLPPLKWRRRPILWLEFAEFAASTPKIGLQIRVVFLVRQVIVDLSHENKSHECRAYELIQQFRRNRFQGRLAWRPLYTDNRNVGDRNRRRRGDWGGCRRGITNERGSRLNQEQQGERKHNRTNSKPTRTEE